MIRQRIVVAPWLTWGQGQNRIPRRLQEEIERVALGLANGHWNPTWEFCLVERYPLEKDRAWEAYYETISSTAVYLSHLELGQLEVTEEMVRVAERLVEDFAETVSPQRFVSFYMLTIVYDNLQVLDHYGSMAVDDFLQGQFHRPWATATLQRELRATMAAGGIELSPAEGRVQLTALGKEVLHSLKEMLTSSGFLRHRARLIRMNNFNILEDMDLITETLGKNIPQLRKRVIELGQIQPGMTVLELGCGTGGLTFDAGLFEVVGPNGRLVATDPSTGVLAALRRKREAYQASWVEVQRARAERLPWPADSFDRVLGYAFLQFTDLEQACSEIARVLKPGGIFASLHPLHFPAQSDFFLEWFEPLIKAKPLSGNLDTLPGPDTVPAVLGARFEILDLQYVDTELLYSFPSLVVKAFVDVANVFEEPMMYLPWRAREAMIDQLIKKGEEIVRKYPAHKLVEQHPCQLIRARVRK
ncbi:class I SAM-dependent methyltransferase [Alicyclobacillus shizuokensis]|uniref:class I SAM-dependent methyltransferase n=1 Tax=Alicyclobacillus shizuokensis TaxID=392014 RepID=UPI00146FD300|nr:methyltransferase domain-containing protein [Alicyclobacillus shizuokensis]